ncbi:hypothetical protein ACFJGX_20870 [Hydrogenophaga sp. UC242_50]|uniref:hypothetical protein n=1 Tax=Hydrogenophaga sp. UC242_50 TaxID=3350169 RepID=UPI0036D3C729
MSVLIKVTAEEGTWGWGETYGIVAPEAVTALIDDVLGPVILGRDPRDATAIHEDLYDLMRVRGASGGFWGDAIAGIDIALWDLAGKLSGLPVRQAAGRPAHGARAGLRFRPAGQDTRRQGGAGARFRGARVHRVQVRGGGVVRGHRR